MNSDDWYDLGLGDDVLSELFFPFGDGDNLGPGDEDGLAVEDGFCIVFSCSSCFNAAPDFKDIFNNAVVGDARGGHTATSGFNRAVAKLACVDEVLSSGKVS